MDEAVSWQNNWPITVKGNDSWHKVPTDTTIRAISFKFNLLIL